MRQIDADALKESIMTETLEKDRENLTRRLCYPCREIFTAIDNAPTIEPRHGRWKGEGLDDYRCSLCGEVHTHTRTNFCPNCGADMRGEKDELR